MRLKQDQITILEATTPSTADVQTLTRAYLQTAQVSIAELATRIGYHSVTLSQFLNGTYMTNGAVQNDIRVRRALVDFIQAHPIAISTETVGHLHETSNVQVMRTWFERCLRNRDMAFVYGAPGSQKTFVFEHLIATHNREALAGGVHASRAFYVYCSEGIKPRELLRKMVHAAAIPSANTILSLKDNLRFHLAGRRAVFVLDEAQHLGISALEHVRELNDRDPQCGILLAGSHRLLQTFQARAAELEQWNSRITKGVELPGITEPEAHQIVLAEMPEISPAQIKQLIESSRAIDVYARGKQNSYISARRLFRQIHDITTDPRYLATHQKENAA